MKVLFIVQGEGRGHLTQAISMAQIVRDNNFELAGVLVGKSKHRELPHFFRQRINAPIKTFESPNFLPTPQGRSAGIAKSVAGNLSLVPRFIRSIAFIRNAIREAEADVVINFYELLTGITYAIFRPDTPLVCIAHQYIFLHPDYQFPKCNPVSLGLLKLFTRLTAIGAEKKLALSIRPMQQPFDDILSVVPPLLRNEVFNLKPQKGNYLHGYLLNSGFRSELEAWHKREPNQQTEIFWEHEAASPHPKLHYHPLHDQQFLSYMAGCKGYITTAGFESVCEAAYLGKPVFMVPTHIEQACNAHDAALHGIGKASAYFNLDGFEHYINDYQPHKELKAWIQHGQFAVANELISILKAKNGMFVFN